MNEEESLCCGCPVKNSVLKMVCAKSFHKNKQAWNCPDNLILLYYWRVPLSTHLWSLYLYAFVFICNHLWEPFWISSYLWSSTRIYFLSLYENNQAYENHHLKQIFYHQNMTMIFCRFRMFPFYVFYLEFFSFYVWLFFCWTTCLWIH